jgi:hypothetical protein
MRIEVTAEDIAEGVPQYGSTCAVGRALRRATGVGWYVDGEDAFRLLDESEFIPLPPEAIGFVGRFDAGLPVEPLAFEFPWERPA